MERVNKELLLKDLCPRLPYGVIMEHHKHSYQYTLGCGMRGYEGIKADIESGDIPYLRPMSSMTEEEITELKELCTMYLPSLSPNIGFEDYGIMVLTHHFVNDSVTFKLNMKAIDWLNANHFDYRGLIEKGLALEAPKGMYKK